MEKTGNGNGMGGAHGAGMDAADVLGFFSGNLRLAVLGGMAYVIDGAREGDPAYDFGVYDALPAADIREGRFSLDSVPDVYVDEAVSYYLQGGLEDAGIAPDEAAALAGMDPAEWPAALAGRPGLEGLGKLLEVCSIMGRQARGDISVAPMGQERLDGLRAGAADRGLIQAFLDADRARVNQR